MSSQAAVPATQESRSGSLTPGRNSTDSGNRDIEKQEQDLEPGHDVATGEEEFLVVFEDDDPAKPINWPFKRKAYHTMLYGLATFGAQFNSSVMAPVSGHLVTRFGVSTEVATLGTSLYVLGIAFGPMIFAPFSEVYGRKMGVFLPFLISTIFTMGTASSENMAAILCTRFFAGVFGAAAVVSSGGVLADIWSPASRAVALVAYAIFVVAGPNVSPIFSALCIQNSETAVFWPLWMATIVNWVILIVAVIFVKETYNPLLLAKRAHHLRITTRNFAYHAKYDEWSLSIREFFTLHCMRPILMLMTPIVFFIALYASFVFGVLYLFLTTIPYTFGVTRGWTGVVAELPLLALMIGTLGGGFFNVYYGKRYGRLVAANGGKVLPEERLMAMMVAGWLMPVGMFIYAWTSTPKVHWIAPLIGIALCGTGFFTIFQGCLNYLVDSYTKYAASAIAANTLTRSVFGAVFPLFGTQMYKRLTVHWAGTLLGCICILLLPIPYVFYRFGERMRQNNPYAKKIS